MPKVSPKVNTSANVIVNHMPVMPNSQLSRYIPAMMRISALDAEITAEITPLPYAVKKPEANTLMPPISTAGARHLVPITAISYSSVPGRSYSCTIMPARVRHISAAMIDVTKINRLE